MFQFELPVEQLLLVGVVFVCRHDEQFIVIKFVELLVLFFILVDFVVVLFEQFVVKLQQLLVIQFVLVQFFQFVELLQLFEYEWRWPGQRSLGDPGQCAGARPDHYQGRQHLVGDAYRSGHPGQVLE